MNETLFYIVFGFILFIIIYIIDYYFILKPKLKNKKKKRGAIVEVEYLAFKFKIEKKKLMEKWIFIVFAILNSFIISVVSTVIIFIPFNMVYQFLIAFLLLIGLIYSLYDYFGRYLIKKGL